MENNNYKEVLLKIAVCAIAADGKIDDREIEALYNIEKKSPYLSAINMENILTSEIEKCNKNIPKYIESTFNELLKEKLNIVQEMTLLEISFIIIMADGIEVTDEQNFIIDLRKHLDIDDFMLAERFGSIDYLGISSVEDAEIIIKTDDDEKNLIESKE